MIILDDALSESVVNLHQTARIVEKKYGICELSETIRKLADELTNLAKSGFLKK